VATHAGRALASDHEALWYAVAHRLGSGHDFAATVTELALLLVEAGEVAESTLVRRVGAGVVGEGGMSGPAASRRTRRPSAPSWPRHCGCWRCSGCAALAGTGVPGGCAHRARPRARPGGAACPRHRSPARPARPMTSATSGGDGQPGSAAPPAAAGWSSGPSRGGSWREAPGAPGTCGSAPSPSPASMVTGPGSATRSCGAARVTWWVRTGRPSSVTWRTCPHGLLPPTWTPRSSRVRLPTTRRSLLGHAERCWTSRCRAVAT
jgi:hypothetical protein